MEKIPSFLYGKFVDVKQKTKKVIASLKQGVPIGEIASKYEFIEISTVPGQLILNGPNPLTGGQDHFNLFVLPRLLLLDGIISNPNYNKLMQIFFNDMMENFWSHLVMSCGQSVYQFYNSEQNRILYIKNILRYREKYITTNSYFDCLPLMGWNLKGELTTNINSIFDHPNLIAKFVVGNLNYVKDRFSQEEINSLLVSITFFEFIDKFDIKQYVEKNENVT